MFSKEKAKEKFMISERMEYGDFLHQFENYP